MANSARGCRLLKKRPSGNVIEEGSWNCGLLRGQLALVEKDYIKAASLLRGAFMTTLSVTAEDRVEAGLLLASCYAQTEYWDLVAQVYDQCSILLPRDKSIRLRAADAWRRV